MGSDLRLSPAGVEMFPHPKAWVRFDLICQLREGCLKNYATVSPFRERGPRGTRRVREGETVRMPVRLWLHLMAEVQRPYLWLEAEPLRFKSLWPRPAILFLRNSFQKRTFLMPSSNWQQEYYMASPLWSWVPCLISWTQLPAHTCFSLPPLSPEAYVLQGWESLTCGRRNLSLEAGLQVFHPDFFPGLPSLKQVQDHLVDDIAPKVTERDKSC